MTTTPKKKYTTFYQVMLILSTVGTSFSVLSLFGIPQAVSDFAIAPIYSVGTFATFAITLVSVVALILLWQKKIEGFYLKIGSYIAALIAYILIAVGAQPVLASVTEEALADPNMTNEVAALVPSLVNGIYIGALIVTALTTITFMILWIFAWKRQVKADTDASEK